NRGRGPLVKRSGTPPSASDGDGLSQLPKRSAPRPHQQENRSRPYVVPGPSARLLFSDRLRHLRHVLDCRPKLIPLASPASLNRSIFFVMLTPIDKDTG